MYPKSWVDCRPSVGVSLVFGNPRRRLVVDLPSGDIHHITRIVGYSQGMNTQQVVLRIKALLSVDWSRELVAKRQIAANTAGVIGATIVQLGIPVSGTWQVVINIISLLMVLGGFIAGIVWSSEGVTPVLDARNNDGETLMSREALLAELDDEADDDSLGE